VLRRFFEHLQESVERLGGEHMDLVDDVDLHPPLRGREVHPVPEVPDLVYPPIRSGVHLQHVHRGVVDNRAAALARTVRLWRRPLLAVQPHRQHLRRRGLAGPARPREQVSVSHAVGLYGTLERPHHRLLPSDGVEGAGAPLAVERDVAHI
jgi:hypothetical protein